MRPSVLILLACLTVCLAGCGDHPGVSDSGVSPDGSNVAVPPYTPSTPPTNLLQPSNIEPSDSSSDPLMKSGDTLTAGGHAMEAADPVSADRDPLAQSRGLSTDSDPLSGRASGSRKAGWYWLRGSIENGSVSVSLNGAPCGEFAAFTDREMTRYVLPGMNHITFTSTPNSRMRPMSAHLILYMRAASAQVHVTVPAVTYNLSAPAFSPSSAKLNVTPLTNLSPSSPDAPSSDASSPNASSPDASTPVLLSRTQPQIAAPQTREMTFFAK